MKVIVDKDTILPDDMTQEELDGLIEYMQKLADSGELFDSSIEIDEDDDLYFTELVRPKSIN